MRGCLIFHKTNEKKSRKDSEWLIVDGFQQSVFLGFRTCLPVYLPKVYVPKACMVGKVWNLPSVAISKESVPECHAEDE